MNCSRSWHTQAIFFAFLALLMLHETGHSQSTLINDSFETGNASPEGWQQGPDVPGVKLIYDKATASDGKRSLSLQKSVERYFPIAQWYRSFDYSKTGTNLELKAKVRAVKATKAIMELQFFNGDETMIGKEWIAYIGQKNAGDKPADHDWKDYGGKAVVPAGTKKIVVALQIYGPGKVWFDELMLRETIAPNDSPKSKAPQSKVDSKDGAGLSGASELPQPQSLKTASGSWTRFVLIPPSESAPKPPTGFPLLLFLPGGDGSIEFHPFIKSIHTQSLGGQIAIAQVIAPPQVVWPTVQTRLRFATTEESLAAIVKDVSDKIAVDRSKVFAIAWSSSGPAVYEALMKDDSPLAGALIAMSVFREKDYASFASVKGRRIYLLHSPEDQVCPYSMAKEAHTKLNAAGATATLVDYPGGHGWHGDIFKLIRSGIDWLMTSS